MGGAYEKMGVNVKFEGQEYELRKTRYPEGGATALVLWDAQVDEMAAVATVNIPEVALRPNEVLIKDYSENVGMLKALEDAGVVKATGMAARSGFVEIPVAELQGRFREAPPEAAKEANHAAGPAHRAQYQQRDPDRGRDG
jgi:hypothetical protein